MRLIADGQVWQPPVCKTGLAGCVPRACICDQSDDQRHVRRIDDTALSTQDPAGRAMLFSTPRFHAPLHPASHQPTMLSATSAGMASAVHQLHACPCEVPVVEVAEGHAGVPPEQCWLWPLPEEPTLSPAAHPWAAEPPSCTCSALVNIASPHSMQSRKDCKRRVKLLMHRT